MRPRHTGYGPPIVIIFATAHDTYMGDAFEVYAFDYLVKPFKVDRVIQTLERARDRLLRRDARPRGRAGSRRTRAAEGKAGCCGTARASAS